VLPVIQGARRAFKPFSATEAMKFAAARSVVEAHLARARLPASSIP
jgi:hypothetical protein